MRTTTTYFIAFVLLLLANIVNAQVYVRADVGVGIGINQDAFGVPFVERDSNNMVLQQQTIFGSFGGGGRFSLAAGYWFTPAFGAELNVYYFQGFQRLYGGSQSPNGSSYQRQASSYQLRIVPSLVVQAPEGKWRPFARFGVVLPLLGRLIVAENWQYNNNRGVRSKQTDISGKFSWGIESSIGLSFAVNERLNIYMQASYTGLRIRSQRAEVTKDEETAPDGTYTNNLDGAPAILTQIEFQDVMTSTSNTNRLLTSFIDDLPDDIVITLDNTLDTERPLNLPTQSSNYNALSLTIGVQYTFSK